MLNKGVLTDASNNSLVDYGLYASGANGTLTLTSSKGILIIQIHSCPNYHLAAGQLEQL